LPFALINSTWPEIDNVNFIDEEKEIDFFIKIITRIRNIKHMLQIPLKKKLPLFVAEGTEEIVSLRAAFYVAKTAFIEKITCGMPPKPFASIIIDGKKLFLDLKGENIEKERERLKKKITELKEFSEKINNILQNKKFLEKAPPEEIEKRKSRLAEIKKELQSLLEIDEAIK